jgi:HNH endonuclease
MNRAKKGSLKGLTCTVDGCNEPMYSKEMCKRHYKQLHRTGSAKAGLKGKHGTVQERFWHHVDKKSDAECWNWLGRLDKNGYGSLRTPQTQLRAHRVSFQIHNSTKIEGLIVRHLCNNPSCVNPAHLASGTQTDNMRDRELAGNVPRNETHPNMKFTDDVVEQVRNLTGTYKEIGAKFGMSESQVGNIKRKAQRFIKNEKV